jgi:transcriptional regulator with XRE-family HTH domain
MNYKKEIGRRIKECREAMDWTLRELAERSDLSASRISNYEQGTRTPKPKEALALGKALGVNPSYLMCLEGDDGMNQEEMNLIRDWRARNTPAASARWPSPTGSRLPMRKPRHTPIRPSEPRSRGARRTKRPTVSSPLGVGRDPA